MKQYKVPSFTHRRKQIRTVADIETQLIRAKSYVAQMKRAVKAASTFGEKQRLAEYQKEAERVLRQLRISSFDIEDELTQE